jgi:hypothetical protein
VPGRGAATGWPWAAPNVVTTPEPETEIVPEPVEVPVPVAVPTPRKTEVYAYWAMIIVMTRRLARSPATTLVRVRKRPPWR